MSKTFGQQLSIPSPALNSFNVLVGKWKMIGTPPAVRGTVHECASFEWTEDEAFRMMQPEIAEPRFPATVAIFGSDGMKESILCSCLMTAVFQESMILPLRITSSSSEGMLSAATAVTG